MIDWRNVLPIPFPSCVIPLIFVLETTFLPFPYSDTPS